MRSRKKIPSQTVRDRLPIPRFGQLHWQTYLLEAETSDRRDVFGCSEVRLGLIASDGLTDRSRRPYRHANQLPVQIEMLIVRCKEDKPHWGAPKIRERLARLYPDVHTPATRCRLPQRLPAPDAHASLLK